MINILHASDFHDKKNTGITFAINGLIEQTRPLLPEASKIVLVSLSGGDVEPPSGTLSERVPMSSSRLASAWRYAPGYQAACGRIIGDCQISVAHVHGVWMHPQYAAVQAARRGRV